MLSLKNIFYVRSTVSAIYKVLRNENIQFLATFNKRSYTNHFYVQGIPKKFKRVLIFYLLVMHRECKLQECSK